MTKLICHTITNKNHVLAICSNISIFIEHFFSRQQTSMDICSFLNILFNCSFNIIILSF